MLVATECLFVDSHASEFDGCSLEERNCSILESKRHFRNNTIICPSHAAESGREPHFALNKTNMYYTVLTVGGGGEYTATTLAAYSRGHFNSLSDTVTPCHGVNSTSM